MDLGSGGSGGGKRMMADGGELVMWDVEAVSVYAFFLPPHNIRSRFYLSVSLPLCTNVIALHIRCCSMKFRSHFPCEKSNGMKWIMGLGLEE